MKPPAEIHASPTQASEQVRQRPTGWRSLQGWPTLLGVGFAAFVALDMFRGEERGHELASIVAASGLVYLCAAALGKPSTAWPVFFGTIVVITAAKMGLVAFDATWLLLGLAVLFTGYGLLRGATRPAGGLPLQAFAMVAFGAIASIALFINQTVGAYLVAAGLFAHAGWDVYHHWVNKVVARSMAEFCFVLDVVLAGAIIVATVAA
jgi:hypothetical protein